MIKKYVGVEAINKTTMATAELFRISRREILKFDEREATWFMRANAIELAKNKFCRKFNKDKTTVGRDFYFEVYAEI